MLVKDAADFTCKPLVMIYNSSMESGVFPDFWKLERVTRIIKSGNKSDANNYRPISIISVFARIFEKIVYDQLYNFLTIKNILTPSQFAFRKLHSTITSLINCTYNWYRNIKKSNRIGPCFLIWRKPSIPWITKYWLRNWTPLVLEVLQGTCLPLTWVIGNSTALYMIKNPMKAWSHASSHKDLVWARSYSSSN